MDSIVQNYRNVLLNCVGFQGRATRGEFWNFVLANFWVSVVLGVFDNALFHPKNWPGPLAIFFFMLVLVPSISTPFRRLHDTGKTGWWLLSVFVPIIGWAVLLYFFVKDSDPDNEYGPNPKQITVA